ncbi:MAG: hypothetical protein AAFR39_04190 [Pseudomonadota bacterium]
MRKRRIILAATIWSVTGFAAANPYIEPDPKIQRGAAEQLAKDFGGLRGTITAEDIPAQEQEALDPIRTQAVLRPTSRSVLRAMTPGDWLRAKESRASKSTTDEMTEINSHVGVPLNVKLPKAAPFIPSAQESRTVRVVYAANAPLDF